MVWGGAVPTQKKNTLDLSYSAPQPTNPYLYFRGKSMGGKERKGWGMGMAKEE